MITARANITDPTRINVTIALTMSFTEWQALIAQIDASSRIWPVTEAIDKALREFSKTHEGTVEYAEWESLRERRHE